MGQYFVIVNINKREYIELSRKLWEICANNDCRKVAKEILEHIR